MTASPEPTAIRQTPAGFTLVELTVSVAVMSVIMVGLGSAMLIAGRALPQAASPPMATAAAAEALEQMTAELRYAVTISQKSATMIEFSVPDRNSDGLPETIRYEWSGTSDTALTRKYNDGAAVEMLADVQEFSLSYDTETISEEVPQGNESAETQLARYTSSWDYGDYAVMDAARYAEYFFPTLPADAVSWKVTRVGFYARRSGYGDTGAVKVQLQVPTTGGMPSGVALDEATLYESTLPVSYLWCQIPYTKASGLSPQQGLYLVFQWQAGYYACDLLGRDEDVTASGVALVKSVDQAVSWYTLSEQSLLFSVYGTVTTAGPPQIQNTYYLNAVTIQARAGADSQSLVQTAIKMVNRPEVSQ